MEGSWWGPAPLETRLTDNLTAVEAGLAAPNYTQADRPLFYKFDGLITGTTYLCTIAANNSAGGMDQQYYYTNFAPTPTSPDFPDKVAVNARLQCSYVLDPIEGLELDGGFPATSSPSLEMYVDFTAPRPNNGALNSLGPDFYWLRSSLGTEGIRNRTQRVNESLVNQSLELYGLHSYAFNYTVGVKSANDGPWDNLSEDQWTNLSCTSPSFRPAAPNVTVMGVLDRSVTIRWDAVDGVAAHGLPVERYAYQICRGVGCESAFATADNGTADGVRWFPVRWFLPQPEALSRRAAPLLTEPSIACEPRTRSGA